MITEEQAQAAIADAERELCAGCTLQQGDYLNAVICTLAWVISGIEHPLKY
jgi:hypothetical protein